LSLCVYYCENSALYFSGEKGVIKSVLGVREVKSPPIVVVVGDICTILGAIIARKIAPLGK